MLCRMALYSEFMSSFRKSSNFLYSQACFKSSAVQAIYGFSAFFKETSSWNLRKTNWKMRESMQMCRIEMQRMELVRKIKAPPAIVILSLLTMYFRRAVPTKVGIEATQKVAPILIIPLTTVILQNLERSKKQTQPIVRPAWTKDQPVIAEVTIANVLSIFIMASTYSVRKHRRKSRISPIQLRNLD